MLAEEPLPDVSGAVATFGAVARHVTFAGIVALVVKRLRGKCQYVKVTFLLKQWQVSIG